MAEVGESSSSNPILAKLVPSESKYSDVEIRSNEAIICSEIASSSPEKRQWCKITLNSSHQSSATLQNISSNVILVDDAVVENGEVVHITSGTEIIPASHREGYLSYRFKVMPGQEPCKQQLKISLDIEHAKCSICLNIWHDVVTVAPCLHNFCNGCFSEWLRRSQDKHSTVLCPHCRAVVQFVGRNHYLHNIEQSILLADSSLRRSDEEVALLDSYASVKSNLVIRTGKKLRRKRAQSPLEDESDSIELPCPQCGAGVSGFHCNHDTVHLQCQACGGMMPSRADVNVPQHCVGCDRAFCGAYWHAQRVNRSDFHPMCSRDTFKPISERTLSTIPFLAHEMNRHEQDITERCIRQTGRALQDVISDWIGKLNNREIGFQASEVFSSRIQLSHRARMPLNHAEMITSGTHVCNECYDKLVSFLLYWFRVSLPRHLLPPDARQREDCWYGYACRTQHHNEEHARKRNHVCRPTRGSNM